MFLHGSLKILAVFSDYGVSIQTSCHSRECHNNWGFAPKYKNELKCNKTERIKSLHARYVPILRNRLDKTLLFAVLESVIYIASSAVGKKRPGFLLKTVNH
jgi:hypothetical protein